MLIETSHGLMVQSFLMRSNHSQDPMYLLCSSPSIPCHSAFLSVGKVTVKSEYTDHSGTEWALILHIL